MDIRDWPLDKIMQLPDHCFGSRWPIITSQVVAAASIWPWLVDEPMPEKIVLWSIDIIVNTTSSTHSYIRFSLGDHFPVAPAEFDAFETLFPGNLDNNTEPNALPIRPAESVQLVMRKPIATGGRRFAIKIRNSHASADMYAAIIFTISSIPREVPDCLISANLRSP